jgi:G3E family GTPase
VATGEPIRGALPPRAAAAPVPTLLLTGFLGAGKTTLLRGWLARRPADERWAVLVNEFGALGVDRALLGGDGADARVMVAEIAGGCACCAARVAFGATLARLLRRGPWDRLFIETTGLGHPGELVDQLRSPALSAWLRVLPPIAVVDATRAALYLDAARPSHRTAVDQAVLARLLVLNRAGAVTPDAAGELAARLGAAPPWPRPVLPTADGTVPLEAVLAALEAGAPGGEPAAGAPLTGEPAPGARPAVGSMTPAPDPPGAPADASTDASASASADADANADADPPRPLHRHRADPGAVADGWWWPGSVEFDRGRLQAALEAFAAPGGAGRACGLLRAKGVFRTARAWYAWQWVDGSSDWQETAWRADSRLEVLAERAVDPDMVEKALRAAARKG